MRRVEQRVVEFLNRGSSEHVNEHVAYVRADVVVDRENERHRPERAAREDVSFISETYQEDNRQQRDAYEYSPVYQVAFVDIQIAQPRLEIHRSVQKTQQQKRQQDREYRYPEEPPEDDPEETDDCADRNGYDQQIWKKIRSRSFQSHVKVITPFR